MGKLSIDDKQVGLSYLPIIANKVILNNSTLKQVITETLNLIFFPFLSLTYKCLLPLLSELKTIFFPSGEKLAETSIEELLVTLFEILVLRSRMKEFTFQLKG